MPLPYLPYAKQSINEVDINAAADSLRGEIITRGEKVKSFEKAVADYCGVQYAVAFNSGTAALFGAYFAAKLTAHDRVLSTPNTFIATVSQAIQLGITPHLVDIDLNTGNLDLNGLKDELKFRSTRGRLIVVPVHFSGIAVDMQELEYMLRSHPESLIIEDAAHAIGSHYPSGEKVGSCAFSHMTIFSFHPAKVMTTTEGGMVTTNDPELYHRLMLYRNNGIERESPYLVRGEPAAGYYEVQAISGNFNFTEFQAALGLSQLQRMESFIEKRRHLVKLYRKLLKGISHLKTFSDAFDNDTAFHLFVVQINFTKYQKTRQEVMQKLHEKGIGTQVHYIPLYRHPALKCNVDEVKENYPQTETYYEQALSLPLYYDLTEEDVERVCKELKSALQK